jgi:RNA polymerase sigma-70 factor (ECF subfamily)
MIDEARVQRLLVFGDARAAASAVIEQGYREFRGYLCATLRDRDDADDAFSLFSEGVWKGLPRFRFESSLRTWLYRIAWNAALQVRDEAWKRKRRRLLTGEASALAQQLHTASAARAERQHDVVDRLRAGLGPSDLSLLVLHVDRRLSWEDVATIMSSGGSRLTPQAAAQRFHRLKERLVRKAEALERAM